MMIELNTYSRRLRHLFGSRNAESRERELSEDEWMDVFERKSVRNENDLELELHAAFREDHLIAEEAIRQYGMPKDWDGLVSIVRKYMNRFAVDHDIWLRPNVDLYIRYESIDIARDYEKRHNDPFKSKSLKSWTVTKSSESFENVRKDLIMMRPDLRPYLKKNGPVIRYLEQFYTYIDVLNHGNVPGIGETLEDGTFADMVEDLLGKDRVLSEFFRMEDEEMGDFHDPQYEELKTLRNEIRSSVN